MPDYARPVIPSRVYRDAAGTVIDYGNRRQGESVPDVRHGTVSNTDRFEPLTLVARTLVDHLASTYDVTVSSEPHFARAGVELVEAVLIAPRDPRSASIVIGFTTLPGVIVRAGALNEFAFPPCGCDACDERVGDLIGRLEDLIFTVVRGGYSEAIDGSMVSYSLRHPGGWQSGECHSGTFPAERLAEAREVLARIPDRWAPWALRAAPAVSPAG
jgi:hypothetical protein